MFLLGRPNQAVEFPTSISKRCRNAQPRNFARFFSQGLKPELKETKLSPISNRAPKPMLDDLLFDCLNIHEQRPIRSSEGGQRTAALVVQHVVVAGCIPGAFDRMESEGYR